MFPVKRTFELEGIMMEEQIEQMVAELMALDKQDRDEIIEWIKSRIYSDKL